MTTVIDSLVLQLGLDERNFVEGSRNVLDQFRRTKEEAKKEGEEIEAQSSKSFNSFLSLKRVGLGMTALFLGGMGVKEFVGHLTNLEAATGRVAKTMDLSAAELSIWQGAAQRMGNTSQGITGTLQGLSSEMNNFMLTGQTSLLGPLNQLGVSLFTANGQLKTSTQLFKDITAAVEGMDPARARQMLTLLGFDQGAINMAIEGHGKLQQALDETSKALRGGFTDKDVEMAKQYQAALADIDQSAQTLSRTLLTTLGPAIAAVMKAISSALQSAPDNAQRNVDDLKSGNIGRFLFGDVWDYVTSPGASWSGLFEGVRTGNFGVGAAQAAPSGAGNAPTENMNRFLGGLSYLETNQRDVGNATSSAQGYFQFLKGTAAMATNGGLPDPRRGSYDQQAEATGQFIRTYYPEAAKAIDAGDFALAERLLNKVWPSLPGGSQQQNPARYRHFNEMLGSPAAAARHSSTINNSSSSNDRTTKIDVGEVNINAPGARSADQLASEIGPALKRQLSISSYNTGLA